MLQSVKNHGRRRFCLLFGVYLGAMVGLFILGEAFFTKVYLYPISLGAHAGLQWVGIPVVLDTSGLASGFCTLAMPQITFRVIHECSGLFALIILAAGLLAYPAPAATKSLGLAIGLGAFAAYGSFRLALLGLVAHYIPASFNFFHLYLMVLLNLGFALYLWMSWINYLQRRPQP